MQSQKKKRINKKEAEKEHEKFLRQFMDGLEAISHRTYHHSNLGPYARRTTAQLLHDLLMKAVEKLKEVSDTHAKVEDVQQAVQTILPPGLFKFAASEGQREIFLTQTMDFNYLNRLKRRDSKDDEKMEDLKRREIRDALTRNIIRGMEWVLKKIMPQTRFDKNGNKYVSHFINTLLDEWLERLKAKNPKGLTVQEFQKFIEEAFPSALASHAKSEGQKLLFEYDTKVFDFIPTTPVSTLSEQLEAARALDENITASEIIRRHLAIGKEFQSGMGPMVDQIHPSGSLNTKCKRIMGANMDSLLRKIVDHLKPQAGRKKYPMVQEFIGTFFPPLMAEHANAEGMKMVGRYNTGEYDYEKHFRPQRSSEATTKSEVAQAIFRSGVPVLCQSIQPKTALHKNTVNEIAGEINALYEMILAKIIDSEVYVTSHDVHRATAELMPHLLSEHAIAEGEKLVALYEMKAIKFVPHRPEKIRSKKVAENKVEKKADDDDKDDDDDDDDDDNDDEDDD